MISPAISRGGRKAIRTLVQLIASGGLTALVDVAVGGLSPGLKSLIAAGWLFVVTFLQNSLESAGHIPVLLPTPALVPVAADVGAVVAPVAGAVEAVADTAGNVSGTVTDVVGDVAGTVTGTLGHLIDEVSPNDPAV